LNHRIDITAGVLEEECREIMQDFFRARRESQRMKDEGGRMKAEG
jgi:tRNA(adenine34) deaminase